jgi:anaerobic selenocysteine-containing dehydrogenase
MIRYALASGHEYLRGITFERLLADGWAPLALPDPWMPLADGHYPTPSSKCEFYSQRLADRGLDPLPYHRPQRRSVDADRFPLVLLTPRSAVHFLNSSYANLPRHLRAEGEPFVDLHPSDARARSISDGDRVRITSAQGSLELGARVGDRVRAGVVAIPSGWWASLSPGDRSANALTNDGLSLWSGGGDFSDTHVEVSPAESDTAAESRHSA